MGIGKFPIFPMFCLCDKCENVHPVVVFNKEENFDSIILAATVEDIHFVVEMLRDFASPEECEYVYVFSVPSCSEESLMSFIKLSLDNGINQALLVNNKQHDYVDLRSFRVSSFSEN